MKERADHVGGRLGLFSSADKGTEIELSVPGSIAFLGWRRGLIKAVCRLPVVERYSARLP